MLSLEPKARALSQSSRPCIIKHESSSTHYQARIIKEVYRATDIFRALRYCPRAPNQQLLIDPFISGNPVAKASPDDFSPSHIIITHAHGDHYGDTEAIATRSGAMLFYI